VGPWSGLDRCGKSRPIGIRSPDRPAHSQSLYRLLYPAHFTGEANINIDLNTLDGRVWSGFIWLRIGVIGVLWFQYNVWNLLTA
jgi:hypothetical protein